MNGIWLVSYLALWLLAALLVLVVAVLARQIGLLHRRLAPSGARMENEGPEIGEVVPELTALDLEGREVTLGSVRRKQTLLLFISATCPTCEELMPAVRSVWKSERNSTEVLMVTLGTDEKRNRDFVARHKLLDIPLIVSESVALQYRVSSPPYGVLVDESRTVRAKGVVNHLEHLESLINAAHSGYPSMENWAESQDERGRRMTLETLSNSQKKDERAGLQ